MNYSDSGVNIDSGNRAVELIKESVKKTYSPFVQNTLGGFSSYFELPPGYKHPLLVSCTDGVGTKIKVAIDTNQLDTIGIDLVAMCVNDLICCGAKPLFFLDYIACHKLIPEEIKRLVDGMTQGCLEAGCSLVGGEMAEMNDLYHAGEFDLAGFSVGIVEKETLINGTHISPGDYVYALPSSGIHSSGFSLVRRIIAKPEWQAYAIPTTTLTTPTKIYVSFILSLLNQYRITGIAHITGGGFLENIIRIMPRDTQVIIKKDTLKIPSVFSALQKVGEVSEEEMYRVFNMGVGMVVISPEKIPPSEDIYPIGFVQSSPTGKNVHLV